MEPADLAYRSARLEVVVLQAQEDLHGAWRSLLSDPVELAAAGMREALPAVVEQYGSLAGENAALWYEDMRPVGAAKYTPQPFTPKSLTDATGLTTWGVTPLFQDDPATAWERLSGTVQRLVSDHDRVTVEENAGRDSAVVRWRRVASADACAYCAYMSVLSSTYTSSEEWMIWSDPAKYHDNCRCVPVMEFVGVEDVPRPNEGVWADVFETAHQEISRDFRKAWDVRPRRRTSGGGWEYERRNDFFKRRPDLTLTTKNILARARRIEPGLFRDGVRSKAA